MSSRSMFILLACTIVGLTQVSTYAQDEGPSLTVYSSADPAGFDPQQFISQQRQGGNANFAWQVPGFGVVRETRKIEIPKGIGEIRFTDVAAFIDPTTVGFRDLTAKGTNVLEQNFEFDLVSPSKLLQKYIDKTIWLQPGDGLQEVEGTLLSASGSSAVLKVKDRIEIVPISEARIIMGKLPGGLITRPTLVWKLQAAIGGEHTIQTNYQTAGLTWRADYNLTLDKTDTMGDLTAWVSLMNLSGASYENAKLKLVAGDVQRVQPSRISTRARGQMMMAEDSLGVPGFEEQSFFEYHLYTLPRRTDVKNNGTQQITLFPPIQGFKVEKELLYRGSGMDSGNGWGNVNPSTGRAYGTKSNKKVEVFISFKNEKDNGLGIPMPAGKVRVYKENPNDGALEFLGEDLIDHTPRNETIRIKTGDAFDVIGERTQVNFKLDDGRKMMEETWLIEIRNQKSTAQEVIIQEPMYRWRTWEITDSSAPFTKVDARIVRWTVDVKPESSAKVTYTVKYTW